MPMRIGAEMPPLNGATQWFNATGAHAEAEVKGHPTLVHFWAISCDACLKGLSRVAAWRDERAGAGLRVIAVHTPCDEADMDVELVREAISLHHVTEPCAVDNEHKLRAAFANDEGDLPAYYLFDEEGMLRSGSAGEHALDALASALDLLLPVERDS